MQPEVWIGTSGYVYKHWRDGVFYPAGLSQKSQLEFFARHFRTVELNNPFYRLPTKATFIAWRQQSPGDFVFAVKASRYITHLKKLRDPIEPMKLFMERARGLGAKLGPVLFQFPGTWPIDIGRLRNFLRHLPRNQEFTFEFRHPSWFTPAVYEALRERRAALCLAVLPSGLVGEEVATANFTYIRMHSGSGQGGNFTPAGLKEWAGRIERFRKAGITVYIYFNNDQHGFAVQNALRLRGLLGIER